MMRVLIIDDEQYIREGLRSLVNWESLNCEVIGEAQNGLEGLEKIRELLPDLCIIDIRMPGLDGTEVIEIVYKEKLDCQFIVLTGFRDFDSASRAMECKVNKYILKPIDEILLEQKIREAYEEWKKKSFHKQLIEEQFVHAKEQLIKQLVLGESYEERYLNERYHLELPWITYQIVLLTKQVGYFTELEKIKVKTLLSNLLHTKECGEVFEIHPFIGIVFKNITFQTNTLLLEKWINKIDKSFSISVLAAIGKPIKDYKELHGSYFDAKLLLDYKFIYSNRKIVDESFLRQIESSSWDKEISMELYVSQIYQAIDLNNMTTINNLLEDMLTNIKQLAWGTEKIKSHYIHFYVAIVTDLINKNPILSQNDFLNGKIFEKIYTQGNLQKLHGFVKHQIVYMSDIIANNRPELIIDKMKDYIERNYDREIRIEEMGKMFNYNSSYLGKQFKQETGVYFNTYVDIIRINKAKEMLGASDQRIYDIAKSVGFNDPDYFTARFKKYEKMSPKEYRNKIINS